MRKYAWNIIAVCLMLLMVLSACERPEEPENSAPSTSASTTESTAPTTENTVSTAATTEQIPAITVGPTQPPMNTEIDTPPSIPDDATAPSETKPPQPTHTHPTDEPTQPPEPSQNTAPTVPDAPTLPPEPPSEPTVPPTEPTEPEETVKPTEPAPTETKPTEPAPTVPAPTEPAPSETTPPTMPEETTPPTIPEETVPPTEPPTEPEETEPPTEPEVPDYTDTLYLDQNDQFVEENDPSAVKKLFIQYDTQWREIYRKITIMATNILVREETTTYHEDGTYTCLIHVYHDDGSYFYGSEDHCMADGRFLQRIEYNANKEVAYTTVYTYHANGQLATQVSEGPGGATSTETYRENGTLIRSESHDADGFIYIRECNEAGIDTYCLAQFPDGASSEQVYNDAGVLICDTSVYSNGEKDVINYRDDGQIGSREEYNADGSTLRNWKWQYNEEGKLYFSTCTNQNGDAVWEWYNDAGIVIKERIVSGDGSGLWENYFDDNGNQTGYSKTYTEGSLTIVDHYNMNDQLIKKERHEIFDYNITEYNEAGEPVVTYYYDKDDNLIRTEYH